MVQIYRNDIESKGIQEFEGEECADIKGD